MSKPAKAPEPHCLGGALRSVEAATKLLQDIRTGRFADADRLPPEMDLAVQLGVSRTVLRDALGELERDGYIERVRGIGTVINRPVATLQGRIDHKLEFNGMIRSIGCEPVCDSVLVTKEQPSDKAAEQLGLAADDTVLVIRKRILADNKPVVYCTDTVPLRLFSSRKVSHLDFSRPLFDILGKELGIKVTKTVTHLRATPGPAVIRRMLGLGGADALLELNEVCYTRLCTPVVSAQTYYTDFYDFSLVRTMIEHE